MNYVHPFREGNGRTRMVYLRQLAEQAGRPLDIAGIDRDAWMAASREAHRGRYDAMARCILLAIGAAG